MASVPIPNLPALVSLNGSEEIPAVQGGTAYRITTAQIVTLASGGGGILPVANGGTGDSFLVPHSVLIGNGTAAVTQSAVGATGTVLAGNTGSDPTFQTIANLMAAYFAALPTSLPGTSGVVWNDGGVVSIS